MAAQLTSPSPVGLIGLGLVGNAIAQRLTAAGIPILGFDLRDEARSAFAGTGAGTAASLADLAARCTQVVLAVFDSHDVLAVVERQDALAAPGSTVRSIIDCSTGTPQILEPLARSLAARGIAFIEAPLSGSSEQIARGEATLLLGGETGDIAGCAPLLAAIATQRIHVGPAGFGAKAKLATNLVLGLNRAVLAEGMVFAEQLGITPAVYLSLVLATPARSAAAQSKGALMVNEHFDQPQSRIRQHLKDVELMLERADASGQRLPLSEIHAQLMRAAVAAGDGELDNAAIVRQLRRERQDAPNHKTSP